MMKYFIISVLFLLIQCEDSDSVSQEDCGCYNGKIIEEIENQSGTIENIFNNYMIIPDQREGRLYVCEGLPDSLEVEGLKVNYSGSILKPCPNASYNGDLLKLTELTKINDEKK